MVSLAGGRKLYPGDNNKGVYTPGKNIFPGIKYGTFSAVPILLNEKASSWKSCFSFIEAGIVSPWIPKDMYGQGTNDSMGVNFGNLE